MLNEEDQTKSPQNPELIKADEKKRKADIASNPLTNKRKKTAIED